MAVTYHAGNILRGTTAERTGGTWTNLPVGWIYIESDGLAIYRWNGTTWDLVGGTSGTLGVASGGTGATTFTAGILKGSGTTAFTTVAAPTGTVVGTSDTQTLTAKTITVEDNTFTGFHPSQALKKTGGFSGTSSTTSGFTGLWQGQATGIIVGTGAAAAVQLSSAGVRARYGTGATTGGINGVRLNVSKHTSRILLPTLIVKAAPQQTTDTRFVIGFTSSSNANPAAGADPLPNLSGVVFFYDSGVSGTNIAICQNDGSATSDATTISNVGAVSTSARYFGLRSPVGDTKFQYYYGSTYPVAASSWTDITTKIPASTTALGVVWYVENLNSATDTFEVYGAHIEQTG